MSGGDDQPAPRNLETELKQTLSGYKATAPGFLALNQKFQPAYTELGLDNLGTQMNGFWDDAGNYHPGTTYLNAMANNQTRQNNLGDLETMGPDITNALYGANPGLFNSLDTLNTYSSPSGILTTLNKQAQDQLNLDGSMSEEDLRALDQGALGMFAQGGINTGSGAVAAQLLGRQDATQTRRLAGQQFAEGVQGLNFNQAATAANAANTFSSTVTNPLLQILQLGNITPGQSGSSAGGSSATIANANDLFNPMSPYVEDLYNTNLNMASSNANAAANRNAAFNNALVQAGGAALFGGWG
jgi:hypothetical protein